MCHGGIWELWFEAVLPKAFLGLNVPSSVRVPAGQDTWHGSLGCVPAVSCLAGSSICSLAGEPWGEVWAVPAGFVLCHCSFCRSCVCVRAANLLVLVFMDLQVSRRKSNH